MAYSGPAISVHVTISVDPSNRDAFLSALKPTFDKVITEPLNIFFEIYEDAKTPGVFKLVENWNMTLDHMMTVQRQKDYYKSYHKIVDPMFTQPLVVEIYNRMPGNEWASVKKDSYLGKS
ncbi:hypothetical protein F5Y14DRAFT_439939 [Nemania sp. NC0429]|nr:hypothetical protein F5Y14DRAFT_439939 [Nemania sp. NC0429]